MGIFTNEKKGCPICGNATPRLFPTKVEGLPLCKECAAKINMESSMLKNLTINELWDHLDYRKANSEAFGAFTASTDRASAPVREEVSGSAFYLEEPLNIIDAAPWILRAGIEELRFEFTNEKFAEVEQILNRAKRVGASEKYSTFSYGFTRDGVF